MMMPPDDPRPLPVVATDGAADVRATTSDEVASTTPPGWAWWLLRAFLTVQATDVFLQPVFEGRFLSGDFGMLAAHRTNATFVGVLAISQVPVAILARRVSRLPGAIVTALIALAVATALQIALGFTRILGIHVPLGVAIVGVSGGLAVWAWTHRPAAPRTHKRATAGRERS